MKNFFLFIATALMVVILIVIQSCEAKVDTKGCEGVLCETIFCSVALDLKYPDGQPVILDSCKVFWASEKCFLEQNFPDEIHLMGIYIIVDDGLRESLENRQETMHFTGYLNGKIVCERDVLVSADCCHVHYLGTEALNQIIYGIPDAVRESKFCELVNVEHIRGIIPSYNAFRETIDKNLPYENKLQLIVGWFLSHSCITDAHVFSSIFGEIAFSFIENGQTVNMIMLVTDNDVYFAGFRYLQS